ncbi:Ppx/GppA phosphatase family protein [Streptomyces calidiresistens]|uniref:Exopolyphosphatase n=1 Tax=Streptomyces calidiresistens TaxID=1485586 RepID=A0A7W3T1D6_9ACTN|nr:Ppx/GppA phosphatase family protein [Streptomyces calidiresistens]MBB0229129.1 exopolyphosphatase [Streptomyces calidiresistens]
MSTHRVAAVDCGTNSIRLLIADIDTVTGTLTDLDRRMEIVRLGQGVDRTGRFAPEALERTFAACRLYAGALAHHGVDADAVAAGALRFVATSASRDVSNREEFVEGVREILGVEPEVITGDEEARLSFTGATRELAGRDDLPGPALVVDIGGGSTEFVFGEFGGTVRAGRSVDIGCVRLTERHLVRDGVPVEPVDAAHREAVRADILEGLDRAAEVVPLGEAGTLIGLAGSVTTVAALALDLPEYDSTAIHHARVDRETVRAVTDRLLGSTHAERAEKAVIHPGRVDVIGVGALILDTVMERVDAREVIASEHDILDGIAWSVTERLD